MVGGLCCLQNQIINAISLAHLCWKLDNDSSCVANILHEKYINNKEFPTNFKKDSRLWKSIKVGWDLYRDSVAWRVGMGSQLAFGSINGSLVPPLDLVFMAPFLATRMT